MRIAAEQRQIERGRINPAFKKGAFAVGKAALQAVPLFLATEVFIGSGEFFTDARVFTGSLAWSQARDLWTPFDGIVGGLVTVAQVGILAGGDIWIDKELRKERRKNPFAEKSFVEKHVGAIGTGITTAAWLIGAAGMTALALAQ